MWRWAKAVCWGVLGSLACVATARAHVAWVTERDSVFEPGQQVTLTWQVTIPHDTVAFEVEFILDPEAEPVPVASVAPDVTSYDWVVPDIVCDTCSLRVIQDNTDFDYQATIPIRLGVEASDSTGAGGAGVMDSVTSFTATTSATTSATATATATGSGGGPVVASTTATTNDSTSGDAAASDSSDPETSCAVAGAPGGGGSGSPVALWTLVSVLGLAASRRTSGLASLRTES